MQQFSGRYIDWIKTGKNLEYLRRHNLKLIKKVCAFCRSQENSKTYCEGGAKCDTCTFEMDNHISRNELASAVVGWSEAQVANWEDARSIISIEDLYVYCQLCEVNLEDIIMFA
ncbi:MAG: helix-turn-helix transcriptional regulator [Clostridia bacterium]|nr:helix-turn-helix transcriptional regulator [Clostridia bacterium]